MSINIINKTKCCGCEACVQVCGHNAITMQEDKEGFRYPAVNQDLCVECGLCESVCQYNEMPSKYQEDKYVFGGYSLDDKVRFESSSGGAFSEIVNVFCDENYVIFGAEANGLNVYHSYITNKSQLNKFRKSKYSQSIIGSAYKDTKQFLSEGKKVLFSGTPCQIAGLKSYLGKGIQDSLLTIEVICEGVPSPLYIRKFDKYIENKYGSRIKTIDYRYTGKSIFSKGKWDFQQMKITTSGIRKVLCKDRWFNPFWSIWLKHLMSRPSCYECPFTNTERVADITLGDLWGVHIYCPELYGQNGGSSLIVCNTSKGRTIVEKAQKAMYGHELVFEEALCYQSPMRKCISENSERDSFMTDLQSDMTYKEITEKWAKKPSFKLLWQKYIWGNRQKIFLWGLKNKLKRNH